MELQLQLALTDSKNGYKIDSFIESIPFPTYKGTREFKVGIRAEVRDLETGDFDKTIGFIDVQLEFESVHDEQSALQHAKDISTYIEAFLKDVKSLPISLHQKLLLVERIGSTLRSGIKD